MIRTTSKIAYKEINEDGTSSNQKKTIANAVNVTDSNKGLSLRELSRITGIDINAVSGRVNELKKEEVLKECDKRKCRVTNRLITPVRLMSHAK